MCACEGVCTCACVCCPPVVIEPGGVQASGGTSGDQAYRAWLHKGPSPLFRGCSSATHCLGAGQGVKKGPGNSGAELS